MEQGNRSLTELQRALLRSPSRVGGSRSQARVEGMALPSANTRVEPAVAVAVAGPGDTNDQWAEHFQRGFTDRLAPVTGVGGGGEAGAEQGRAGRIGGEEYLARARDLTQRKATREMIQRYEPELGKPEMQAVLAAEKSLRRSMKEYGWGGAAVSRRGEAYDFDVREKPDNLVGLARMIELMRKVAPSGSPLADATPRELAGMTRKLMLTYLLGRGKEVAGNRPVFAGKEPKEWQKDPSWGIASAVTNRDPRGDLRIPFSDFLQMAKEILIAEGRRDNAGEQVLVQRFLDLAEKGEIRKFDRKEEKMVVEHAPLIVDARQGGKRFTFMEALNAIAEKEHRHPSFQVEWMLDQSPQKQ